MNGQDEFPEFKDIDDTNIPLDVSSPMYDVYIPERRDSPRRRSPRLEQRRVGSPDLLDRKRKRNSKNNKSTKRQRHNTNTNSPKSPLSPHFLNPDSFHLLSEEIITSITGLPQFSQSASSSHVASSSSSSPKSTASSTISIDLTVNNPESTSPPTRRRSPRLLSKPLNKPSIPLHGLGTLQGLRLPYGLPHTGAGQLNYLQSPQQQHGQLSSPQQQQQLMLQQKMALLYLKQQQQQQQLLALSDSRSKQQAQHELTSPKQLQQFQHKREQNKDLKESNPQVVPPQKTQRKAFPKLSTGTQSDPLGIRTLRRSPRFHKSPRTALIAAIQKQKEGSKGKDEVQNPSLALSRRSSDDESPNSSTKGQLIQTVPQKSPSSQYFVSTSPRSSPEISSTPQQMLRRLIENQTKRAIESEMEWGTALRIANMDWEREAHPEIVGLFTQLQQQCLTQQHYEHITNKAVNRALLNEVKRLATQSALASSPLVQNSILQSPLMQSLKGNTLNFYTSPSTQTQSISHTRGLNQSIYDAHERLLRITNSQPYSNPSHSHSTEVFPRHLTTPSTPVTSASYPTPHTPSYHSTTQQELNAWCSPSLSLSISPSHTSQNLTHRHPLENSFSPNSLDSPPVSSNPSSPDYDGEISKEKGSSCHQCKTRRLNTELTFCCRNLDLGKSKKIRECRKKYCNRCLNKFYNETAPQKHVASFCVNEWSCPSCRLICSCASCRRRSTKVGFDPKG